MKGLGLKVDKDPKGTRPYTDTKIQKDRSAQRRRCENCQDFFGGFKMQKDCKGPRTQIIGSL